MISLHTFFQYKKSINVNIKYKYKYKIYNSSIYRPVTRTGALSSGIRALYHWSTKDYNMSKNSNHLQISDGNQFTSDDFSLFSCHLIDKTKWCHDKEMLYWLIIDTKTNNQSKEMLNNTKLTNQSWILQSWNASTVKILSQSI